MIYAFMEAQKAHYRVSAMCSDVQDTKGLKERFLRVERPTTFVSGTG